MDEKHENITPEDGVEVSCPECGNMFVVVYLGEV
jgi:predicted RNA-binding Zn-ribbon protein involved in translation (DUF1610 family)